MIVAMKNTQQIKTPGVGNVGVEWEDAYEKY
jgi:hypothetical protein